MDHCSKMMSLYEYFFDSYAENFHGGFHSVAYRGHLYLVCAVCYVTI